MGVWNLDLDTCKLWTKERQMNCFPPTNMCVTPKEQQYSDQVCRLKKGLFPDKYALIQ